MVLPQDDHPESALSSESVTTSSQTAFLVGSDGRESACNAGDPDSERSPGEGNGNPLQFSCLENSMDRGA